MTPIQSSEHGSHPVPLGVDGVQVLRRRRRLADETEKALESLPACLASQFVQRLTYGGPIKPPLRVRSMCWRIPPPLQKNFHRQFFRAGLVMSDPANDAGNALIMGTKNSIQSFGPSDFHLDWFGYASCVHIPRTNEAQSLWQRLQRKATWDTTRPRKGLRLQYLSEFNPGIQKNAVG